MSKKLVSAAAAISIVVGSLAIPSLSAPASAQSFFGEDFSCETAASDLNDEINGSQPPASAGLIVQMQHLMWMLEQGMNWLDSHCRSEDNYASVRASWQNSYNSTRNACVASASNSYDCRAVRYR